MILFIFQRHLNLKIFILCKIVTGHCTNIPLQFLYISRLNCTHIIKLQKKQYVYSVYCPLVASLYYVRKHLEYLISIKQKL